MKAEKKRIGTKARISAIKERERRLATAIFLALLLLITVISVYFTYTFLNQPKNQTTNPTSSQLKAAIVDQLSLTFPNQTFIQTATNTLKQANYTVDYYPGEKATVEFYKNLPTYSYDVILLRVHSAGSSLSGAVESQLFTSEVYSTRKYVLEQLEDQVGMVTYSAFSKPAYFGICPKFVQQSMKDKFSGTIIIMMGCEGLAGTQMARAFIEKGAKVYIGWNGSVLASHTDQATACLLQHLITQKETVKQAVNNAMKEIGPDPSNKSVLNYYPLEAGEQKIENFGKS